MPTQQQLLEAIKSHPEGITLAQLSSEFEVRPFALTAGLSGLKKKALITHDGQLYRAAIERSEAPDKPITETPQLPSDYDEFLHIAKSVGLESDFLKSIADFIFRSDPYSIEKVYEALKSLHLRPDIVSRLTHLWAAAINQPVPRQVSEQTSIGAPTALPVTQKKWIILSNKPQPDDNGVYTFNEAIQVIESQNRGQPSPTSGEELSYLRSEISQLRQELTNQTISSLQTQLKSQAESHQRQLEQLSEKLERERGARTELDILSDIARGGIEEARSWRNVISQNLPQALALPPRKTPQQSEARKANLKQALETDKRIEQLGRELFFGEKFPPEEPQKEVPKVPEVARRYE